MWSKLYVHPTYNLCGIYAPCKFASAITSGVGIFLTKTNRKAVKFHFTSQVYENRFPFLYLSFVNFLFLFIKVSDAEMKNSKKWLQKYKKLYSHLSGYAVKLRSGIQDCTDIFGIYEQNFYMLVIRLCASVMFYMHVCILYSVFGLYQT